MSTTAEESEHPEIEVSEAASNKALALLEEESLDTDTAGLRPFVQQGGCVGLPYGMRFDTRPDEDDLIYEHHGLRVFVDPASIQYIGGVLLSMRRVSKAQALMLKIPTSSRSVAVANLSAPEHDCQHDDHRFI